MEGIVRQVFIELCGYVAVIYILLIIDIRYKLYHCIFVFMYICIRQYIVRLIYRYYHIILEFSKTILYNRYVQKLTKNKPKRGRVLPYYFSFLFLRYFLRVASPPRKCLSDLFLSSISLTI